MWPLSCFTCSLLHYCRFQSLQLYTRGFPVAQLTDHEYKSVFCEHCGFTVRVPVYCRNRFCPMCSKARMWKIRSRMTELLRKSQLSSRENYKLLTLTIKNQSDLAPMCKQLLHSFRKLRHRSFWMKCYSGGCFVVEITGVAGYWHAHLHIIVQGEFCPQSELLRHWRQINKTGGVYIQKINKKGIIWYLTKYLTKEADPASDSSTISEVLKDFRLFQPFGSWHGLIGPYKKRSMPCPDCGCRFWIPAHVIEREIRVSFPSHSRKIHAPCPSADS